MENSEILSRVDHTLLKATATADEVAAVCKEALLYHTASACIPPCYVGQMRRMFPELNICTVVGFPLGYNETIFKASEAHNMLALGANEIDMVINLGLVKAGDYKAVLEEIRTLKYTCERKILKVIVETCYLTREEKIRLCECVTEAGADYIKTSTGFGSAGADLEDIRLFKEHIGENVKIKAAGGIKTREQLEMFINEGCDRIGTSSAVKLLMGEMTE